MNYPSGTIVQNYNVSAGRVIQLPCFMDQQTPPDDFRALIFATPTIQAGAAPINQIGPDFASGADCAIQFDLTQLLQQNALSRARSIVVSAQCNESDPLFLLFDSGLQLPVLTTASPNAAINTDFLSANPIFGILAPGLTATAIFSLQIAVSNFKMYSGMAGF